MPTHYTMDCINSRDDYIMPLGKRKQKALDKRNLKIKEMYDTGEWTQEDLAQELGLSLAQVHTILKRMKKQNNKGRK